MVISPTVYERLLVALEEYPPVLAITCGVNICAFNPADTTAKAKTKYNFFMMFEFVVKKTN
jgi:hypothetical protein